MTNLQQNCDPNSHEFHAHEAYKVTDRLNTMLMTCALPALKLKLQVNVGEQVCHLETLALKRQEVAWGVQESEEVGHQVAVLPLASAPSSYQTWAAVMP